MTEQVTPYESTPPGWAYIHEYPLNADGGVTLPREMVDVLVGAITRSIVVDARDDRISAEFDVDSEKLRLRFSKPNHALCPLCAYNDEFELLGYCNAHHTLSKIRGLVS